MRRHSPFPFLLTPHSLRAGFRVGLTAGALAIGASAYAHEITVQGMIVIGTTDNPGHGAEVLALETGQRVYSDEDGAFEVLAAPEEYPVLTLLVELGGLSARRIVEVEHRDDLLQVLAEPIAVDITPHIAERITVTASAGDSSSLDTFSSVSSLAGSELQGAGAETLAALLEGRAGVAIRSAGPGSTRPILRGFDGDRVLIMEDGIRTGDLSATSVDHGVPVDGSQAERVEVVRGPATLLYGANAIGGAVNVISMGSHLARRPPPGFRGQASLAGSVADEGRRAGTRLQAGGDGWFVWGGGNTVRTGDYEAPGGAVENTHTRMDQGEVGIGLLGDRAWFSVSGKIDDSLYGVPFHAHGEEEHEDEHHEEEEGEHHEEEEEGEHHEEEEEGEHHEEDEHAHEDAQVDIAMDRRQLRTDFGIFDPVPGFDEAAFAVRYSDYGHDEIEVFPDGDEIVATTFDNRSIVFRGELKRTAGKFRSRLGGWGHLRDFSSAGEEALTPEVRQNAFAAFAYNEFQVGDRFDLLLGARLERSDYQAGERPEAAGHAHEEEEHHEEEEEEEHHDEEEEEEGEHHDEEEEGEHHDEHEAPPVRDRDFLSASGSLGARLALSDRSALVGTVTYSTRAPAIEELYNFGPHAGTMSFDIGDPNLDAERSLGFEMSLRHRADQFDGSINFFRYQTNDFIFGAATGEVEGGFPVLEFGQTDARYQGFDLEAGAHLGAAELSVTASWVDARLTRTNEYAPRIPPLQGKAELRLPIERFSITPRVRWAARMDRLYTGETPTDGYAVFDLTAAYVFVGAHTTHSVSLRGYNLTDAEYRYHTSIIKDRAPQIGRGFRLSYSIRFF